MRDRAEERPLREEEVRDDLQRHPHVLMMLAANSLSVAESLRDNYFSNTARFVSALRRAVERTDPIMAVHTCKEAEWSAVQGEVVTFLDGGIGEARISCQVPILLRVVSYFVRPGGRDLAAPADFGYYP